ncbi:hypothetical protein [Celerinatantimonas sp. YJH-8]|uniref:hypothetical protein n=1 Tax=Celerinatantimonas sp. YJH-8 TaxID=3228714 RepID=UPI0038C5E769
MMNYTQNTHPETSTIKENEWALSNRLNFSPFTSCIGLVGYDKNRNGGLWGIHLVQAVDDFFNDEDAKKVSQLAVAHCEKKQLKLFGCASSWELNTAYSELKRLLANQGFRVDVITQPKDDGSYTTTYNTVTGSIDIVKS